MFAETRQNNLLALLEKQGRLTVQEIQSRLKISPATVRRDLAALAKNGQVVRMHGGVVHPSVLQGEPIFQNRVKVAAKAKKIIADLTLKIIPDNATIYLDSGTTALSIGQTLIARSDLTIITNSLPLIMRGKNREE